MNAYGFCDCVTVKIHKCDGNSENRSKAFIVEWNIARLTKSSVLHVRHRYTQKNGCGSYRKKLGMKNKHLMEIIKFNGNN